MQAINVYAILEYCDPHAEPGQLSAGYSHLASLLVRLALVHANIGRARLR